MSYFSREFIQFFIDLSRQNNTTWFNDHRSEYEKFVKKPFAVFVQDLIHQINKYDPEVAIKAGDAILRINRDIRFAKDKTPYNTHVAAVISATGRKDKSYPGIYIQFSSENILFFGGAYQPDSTQLEKIREFIANDLKSFAKCYQNKKFVEKFGMIQGEQSKRLSKRQMSIKEKEPLIANKQFFWNASLESSWITQPKLMEKLMDFYLASKPLNDFLIQAWK